MSLFSRLFRKAPSPSPAPAPRADAPKPDAAERAQAAAAEEAALQAAIAAGDSQAVARLVVAGSSTRIRQAAAHAVEDEELLRQLTRELRGGNDKGVYKILSSKRDLLLEQARKAEQLRARIEAAAADLERHSRRDYDTLYGPRLDAYVGAWEVLAAQAEPGLQAKAQEWIARARETLAEPLRQAEARAAQEQAAAEAERLRREQEQAAAAAAAEQETLADEQQLALARQQQAEQQTGQQAQQQAIRQIGEAIRKARAALGDGSSARAAGLRRSIDEKLAGAPPLPANLASQLQQLDQQLAELKDWKNFSVAPKRIELIEEMQSLIGAELDPPTLAERIKGLQEEWRALSKGAGESFEADWQRFQEASKQAYQPCSEYFAAQALVRQENLQRREALLARLAAFEAEQNWEQPDWRRVINTLRDTRQEWRSHAPVDRAAGKQQQERFDAVSASLQGRLDAEYARNLQQKQALIERARQLLASEDARKAIDAIKQLQQQWRHVGPVPREADQRLWGEFRQHCDGVFQKRQQEFASYTAGLESSKAQAVALCEQLEQIAALQGPELLERTAALAEMRKAFEALGEFPRADSRELHGRFERGLERCQAALARQRARDAERAWTDLFEAADQVRAYRLAVAQGLDAEQRESLKQAAERHMAAVPRWPKGALQALKHSLAHERPEDLAANEAALRLLCVRAEILTDTPTPAEDQPLRREYQLQRLVQNMGQSGKADEPNLDALAMAWLDVGPVEAAVYQPLLQRFRQCRERGLARAS